MDPISHYMIPWLAGRRLSLEKTVYRAFLLASVIPDIDVVTLVFGFDYLLQNHATVTHSIFGGLLLALGVALIFREGRTLPWALAGVYLHILIDVLLNTGMVFKGGCPLLWPFSDVKCLLVYYVDVPVIAFRAVYLMIAILAYVSAFYYISKKEYPWGIWTE
jgi:membrane-bound metal-dependent hydrolase YbcI (DUF457 family)